MAPNERAEVTYLQSLSEAELREIVLIPLLIRMGYKSVRSLHGPVEQGNHARLREFSGQGRALYALPTMRTNRSGLHRRGPVFTLRKNRVLSERKCLVAYINWLGAHQEHFAEYGVKTHERRP